MKRLSYLLLVLLTLVGWSSGAWAQTGPSWGTITNDVTSEWSNVYGTGTGTDRQRFSNLYFTTDGVQTEVNGLPTASDLQAMASNISLPLVTDGITLTGGKRTTISWTDAGSLSYDYIHAFIDKDGDGTFETSLGTVGTAGNMNSGNGTGTIAFTVPTVETELSTRIRIRIDGAWYSNVASLTATSNTNRLVYDIPVTITPGDDGPNIYPEEGKMYTIRVYYKDDANPTRYLTTDGTNTTAPTELATDGSAYWIFENSKFKSALYPTKYLLDSSGLKVNTTGHAFTFQEGTVDGTITLIANNAATMCINSNGRLDGGRYGDKTKTNTGSGWSTDFILEEASPMQIEDGKLYTINGIIDNGNVLNYLEVTSEGAFTITQGTATGDLKSLWVAHQKDADTFTFTSAADPTKFLSAETGVSSTEYTWDISDGTAYGRFAMFNSTLSGGRFVASKNDGGAFGKWGTGGHWAGSAGQWSTYSTEFVFTENTSYNIYNVVVTGLPSQLTGYAIIDGKNIANGSSVVTATTITAGNLEVVSATTIAGYDITKTFADNTITITYGLGSSIFNANLDGEVKYVRISNVRNPYSVYANSADGLHSHATDFTDENELFALVGTADNFMLYSKTQHKYYGYANGNGGSAVTAAETTNRAFKLVLNNTNEHKGYNIVPVSDETQSFNMHSGAGNDIKFFSAGDGGSTWNVTLIDKTAQGGVIYAGTEPQTATNTKLGKVTMTNGTSTSTLTYNVGDARLGTKTYYLNSAYPFSLSVNTVFRGYTASVSADNMTVTFTADEDNEYQYLWYSTDAAHPYRIPAIATLLNGDLLAVNDYRPCGGDIGNGKVDLVKRISTNNGATWSAGETIIEGITDDATNSNDGFGDPALCVDRESGKVLLMCVTGRKVCTGATRQDPNRVARFYSNDGGQTFTNLAGDGVYDDITESVYALWDADPQDNYTMQSVFIGSGRIFQSNVIKAPGAQYYRIYAALWTKDMHNRVAYSDDFGETWHILGTRTDMPFPNFGNANEPKCEELPDGSVIMASRKPYGRYYNIFTYTDAATGQGSWSTGSNASFSTSDGNGTNGETMVIKAKKADDETIYTVALQSLPWGSGRSHVGFYYKDITDPTTYQTDGANDAAKFAAGWTQGMQVTDRDAAYSTFTIQKDGKVGFYYEEGPAGYEMVYVPLTIEQITKGAYVEIVQENDFSGLYSKVLEAAQLDFAKAALVTYPAVGSDGYVALKSAINAAETIDTADRDACVAYAETLNTALASYYAESNIVMPKLGGVYNFKGFNFKNTYDESDDVFAYLTDTNTSHLTALGTGNNGLMMSTEKTEGANWLCISAENGQFQFVSAYANSLGYQQLTSSPAIVLIQRANAGDQAPSQNGSKPYHNMFGFVNVKVGNAWMCAIPAQSDGAWNKGDKQNGIAGNTNGLDFGVSWAGSYYYPDWQIAEADDANVADYMLRYADAELNKIGNPINDEYTALQKAYATYGSYASDENMEALQAAIIAYKAIVGTTINANTDVVLPTGYYTMKSVLRRGYLYNDYELDASRTTYTLMNNDENHAPTQNSGIWKITNNGDGSVTIVNGQGSPLYAPSGTGLSTLNFGMYNGANKGIYFTQNINTANNTMKFTINGTEYYHVGVWNNGNCNDNNWTFEPVEGDFWTVTILGGDYVKSGTQYMRNGGFVALGHTPTDADFTKEEGKVDMRVLVNEEQKTITVCYGETLYNNTVAGHRELYSKAYHALVENTGLGYPRCDFMPNGQRDPENGSAARTNLYTALSMADVRYNGEGDNGSTLYVETLEGCLDAFYRDSDIELPIDGHVYAIQAHFFDKNNGVTLDNNAAGTVGNGLYITDTNKIYMTNLVKGFGSDNGMKMNQAKTTGYLQNGAYWMAHKDASGKFYFTSAIGNGMGEKAIHYSTTSNYLFYLCQASAYNTKANDYVTFGDFYLRFGSATGKLMGSNKSGAFLDAASDNQNGSNGTFAWRLVEADMNYVYNVNVNSDKPANCPAIQPLVNVTVEGNLQGFDFSESASGYGFFVLDQDILNGPVTWSASDIMNGDPNDVYRRLEAGTPVVNQARHTIDVTYTFDYASVLPHLYAATDKMLHQTGFGYPKYDGDVYTDWRPETTVRADLKSALDAKKDYVNAADFSDKVAAAACYSDLIIAQSNYYANMTDADVIIPDNGSPVLLVNEFYNEPLFTTYRNYAFDKQNNDLSLTLTLAMPGTRTEEEGKTSESNILPDNISDPMQFARYIWTIQRDNVEYITQVTETSEETAYTGGDKYARTQSANVDVTVDEATALGYTRPSEEVTPTVSENGLTSTYVYDVLVDGADGQLNRTTSNGSTRYTHGSDDLEKSMSTIHGTYLKSADYDEIYVRETRIVVKTQKTTTGLVPVLDELGQPTIDENGVPVTEETSLPVYVYNDEETTDRYHTEGEGEEAHDVANEPVYTINENSTYEKVTMHVVEKVANVAVMRNFPTYYISATVGDGYLGRTSVSSATAILTTDHYLQFNVAFVKGTRIGTVGMLFVFSEDPKNPRYISGDLRGSRFDRYNFQTGYDTEHATQFGGIWSTDWNFVPVTTVNTHKDGDQLMVGDKYVNNDDQANKGQLTVDEPTETVISTTDILSWEAPIFEGYPVRFIANDTKAVDDKTRTEADQESQYSYATLKLPYAVYLPVGVTKHVYVLRAVYNGAVATRKQLALTDIINDLTVTLGGKDYIVLPRETPVMIEHNALDKYYLSPALALQSLATPEQLAQLDAAVAGNLFKGTLGRQRVSEIATTPYVLAKRAARRVETVDGEARLGDEDYNTVAFYRYTGTFMPANKAFVDWDGVEITDAPTAGVKASTWMIDDEAEADIETGADLIIEIDTVTGEIYDIVGRKLDKAPRTGVYIQNGKKYIAK